LKPETTGDTDMNINQTTKDALLVILNTEMTEYKNELESSYLSSTPFVVMIDGMFVSPDIDKNGTVGTCRLDYNPLRATRYSREDATKLAAITHNGNGDAKAIATRSAVAIRQLACQNIIGRIS
jgi:hypothetical protein